MNRFRRAAFSFLISLMLGWTWLTPAFAPPAYAEAAQAAEGGKSVKPKPAKKTKRARQKLTHRRHAAYTGPQSEDERFAALVMNADTGRVLYAKNAEAIRHPASLTKMMTLYLVFEALKSGKWQMDTELTASEKAAGQPSTNISMIPGERIPVRTILESLIVRSANDSAMVVAEALAETQWNFALLMNRKARQLGMKHTSFYNPNGLPDPRQVTTAMDLAKLGIALRRDFPEYYGFFKLDHFEWDGRSYEGHNRLLGRYPGADGIKTGYIATSGYNLVTSVTRGKLHIVGVVLGGRTAAGRDQEMINMLDRTFIQLATEQATIKPVRPLGKAPKAAPAPAPIPEAEEETIAPEAFEAESVPQPVLAPPPIPAPVNPAERREEKPLAAQTPELERPAERGWGVQVGTFSTQAQAETAIASAEELAGALLASGKPQTSSYAHHQKTYWRARFSGLTEQQARDVCGVLAANYAHCLKLRVAN